MIKIPTCLCNEKCNILAQIIVICIFSQNNNYLSYIISCTTIIGVTLFYCTQKQELQNIRNGYIREQQRRPSVQQFLTQQISEKKISLQIFEDLQISQNTLILDENLEIEYISPDIKDVIGCESTFLDDIKVMKVDKITKKNLGDDIKDLTLRKLISLYHNTDKADTIVILNTNIQIFEYLIIKIYFQKAKVIFKFDDVKEYAKYIKKHSCFALMNKLFQSFSHEFGGLLNQIALIAQYGIVQFPEQNEQYEQIYICCGIMNNMVKDLKDFHRLQSKTFQLEVMNVEIDEIFAELKKHFEQKAKLKKINLFFDNKVKCKFQQDEQRIKQILQNLLQNAIKFTGQDGGIWISAERQDEKFIKFLIMDSGIGINEVEANNIRQLLSNDLVLTQKISQGAAGLGLGLLNSNNLIKHLNQSRKQKSKQILQFISEEQKGTTFWFLVENYKLAESQSQSSKQLSDAPSIQKITKNLYFSNKQCTNLPIPPIMKKFASCPPQIIIQKQPSFTNQQKYFKVENLRYMNQIIEDQNQSNIEEPSPNQIPETFKYIPSHFDSNCKCPKILLVDDEAFNLKILQQLIQHLGYNTELANSGQQAINLINQRAQSHCQVRLILMDINMPHMNGIETTYIIKQNYPNIIVIGCSAFSDVETKYKAQQAGMENYIEKPIAKSRLQEMFGLYL